MSFLVAIHKDTILCSTMDFSEAAFLQLDSVKVEPEETETLTFVQEPVPSLIDTLRAEANM